MLSKFQCWQDSMIEKVMDTEALHVASEIFLATHHPIKMYKLTLAEGFSKSEYNEEQFLRDFQKPSDYIFVAALGGSGTGKSHLVRWLSVKITSNEKRRVLLIPKAGTNLKKIVQLILEGLEGHVFDEYRSRLENATSTLTVGQSKEMLLSNLALAVGPNGSHQVENLTDEQGYIMEEMPNLLYDPFFRKHLLEEGGIIDKLTLHILGDNNGVERRESRCEFGLSDLPLNLRDIQQASAQARNFYSFLVSNPEFQPKAVEWLNVNLNEAISKVLDLRGEDLTSLMLDVRATLAEQGMELVILIEDFAKLQGIDQQLLEALLVKPNQLAGRRLCALRVALACTTGYFNRLEDTVRQRIEFRVNLELDTSGENKISTTDMVAFVSRYLNAARLKQQDLIAWVRDGDIGEGVGSTCQDCKHISDCHSGFGNWKGYGLYPFNATAIKQMHQRVSKDKFNPRLLVNQVLRATLQNYGADIKQGAFPPSALAAHFSGINKLSALTKNEINRRDPQNGLRRQVLLEFWSEGEKVVDLHPVIHQAFNLPTLQVNRGAEFGQTGTGEKDKPFKDGGSAIESGKGNYKDREDDTGKGKVPTLPHELEQKLKELDNWQNGSMMSQKLSQDLRDLVYAAVTNYIEWDSELLLATFHKGAGGKPFQPKGVNFIKQSSSLGRASVELNIPIDNKSFEKSALALQAMLLYNHYGHWKFENGPIYLRKYIQQLENWSSHVLKQLREWDPVPATAELLGIGALLVSKAPGLKTVPQMLNAVVAEHEQHSCSRSRSWSSLGDAFIKSAPVLKDILLSRVSCTKGVSGRSQVVDASQLVSHLQGLMEKGKPTYVLPDKVKSEFKMIEDFKATVEKQLTVAISDEKKRCVAWYEKVTENLGEATQYGEVISGIKRATSLAKDNGVFPHVIRADQLERQLNSFGGTKLAKLVSKVAKIRELQDDASLLIALAELDCGYMAEVGALLENVNGFLDGATSRVTQDIQGYKSRGGDDLITVQQDIKNCFSKLSTTVNAIQGVRS